MRAPKPLILFIDAYDSFSNNIVSLLETNLDVSVRTVKIDDELLLGSDVAFRAELRHYAAIVCGPGPGNPQVSNDVGLIRKVWDLAGDDLLPVLGICLGFQSLCLHFGGEINRLKGPQHGIVRRVKHVGESNAPTSIFHGVGEVHATLYQSLCADIGHGQLSSKAYEANKWLGTRTAPMLRPLAWVEYNGPKENDYGVQDERVLVAVQHKEKPFWGLQYHPESICTNDESKKLMRNWYQHAQAWNQQANRKPQLDGQPRGQCSVRESLLSQAQSLNGSPVAQTHYCHCEPFAESPREDLVCHYRKLVFDYEITTTTIVEAIQDTTSEQIILESSNSHAKTVGSSDVKGRHSIIALDVGMSTRFEYVEGFGTTKIEPSNTGGSPCITKYESNAKIWPLIAKQLSSVVVTGGQDSSPFWGGFMGYTTYELGLQGINVNTLGGWPRRNWRPDLCFAWITRSLVIDHIDNSILVQVLASPKYDIKSDDQVNQLVSKLNFADVPTYQIAPLSFKDSVASLVLPSDEDYESKVARCQSHIRAGESYELCLTAQTKVNLSSAPPSWEIYKSLRARQPAPFASYIRLGAATFISASPERFVKWSENGECELRPMKGTVKKSPAVQALPQATALLDIPKEKAENLMIVDLVRHDLHGICGSGNVQVPRLMVVEEYASVFQMISVVKGQIPPPFTTEQPANTVETERKKALATQYTGLDVLAASLPPGSMTGAPKKRSCEILAQDIEPEERSLYSGVVGYVDVRGRGDWSVNIRCLFKWDDEDRAVPSSDVELYHEPESADSPMSGTGIYTPDCDSDVDFDESENTKPSIDGIQKATQETWHIGAGGAVTILSTPIGEREEMLTKLGGTLALFR